MSGNRVVRLNSLLKEVISEVIKEDVRNPHVSSLVTVTRVDITRDLHHAKVFISVIGTDEVKKETMIALNNSAGFIAVNSSHKVTMRYFPELHFKLDDSVDKHMRIEELLGKISTERANRSDSSPAESDEDSDDNSFGDDLTEEEEEASPENNPSEEKK